MGALPIVLLILAMKIPIFGLITFVWWLQREPAADGPTESVRADKTPPLRPQPWRPGRRRPRGPHGGASGSASRAYRRSFLGVYGCAREVAASRSRHAAR